MTVEVTVLSTVDVVIRVDATSEGIGIAMFGRVFRMFVSDRMRLGFG